MLPKRNCEACRNIVDDANNATLLEFIISANLAMLGVRSRHLLPVVTNGIYVCEGAPNLAQYIEGQPRDYDSHAYNQAFEAVVRFAHAQLQDAANDSEDDTTFVSFLGILGAIEEPVY